MASARRLAANLCCGVASNVARLAVQLVMLPVMARVLGPAELGLYALAIPLINFVMLLTDAGFGDSLARERDDHSPAWSSVFWALIIMSIVGAAAAIAVSMLMARVAAQPRLPGIVAALTVTLPLLALMIIPNARMLRAGNTVPGALGEMVAAVLGAIVGIVTALAGYGVWALVAQFVTASCARALCINVAQPFRPKMMFDPRSLVAHSGMGSQIILGRLGELGVSMFERSRISARLGPVAVGGYANAIQIGTFTANAVGNPLWANLYHLAITRRSDEAADALIRAHRIFALMTFPAATALALAAPTYIPILLGHAWDASIGAIVVMLLSAPFGNLAAFHSAILFAQGAGRTVLIGQTIMAALRVALVVGFWRYGIIGLASGLGMLSILYYGATSLYISRRLGIRADLLFTTAAPPLLASCAVGAMLRLVLGVAAGPTAIVSACLAAGAAYVALLRLGDPDAFQRDISGVLDLIGRRARADAA